MYDLLIRGGTVVTETAMLPADVAVRDGKIAAVLPASHPAPAAARVIDARGRWVMPGAVDAHSHFCDPGYTEWEDFYTGTASAAAGGFTTIVEMPLTNPMTVNVDAFRAKRAIAAAKAVVDYALWGGLVPGCAPQIAPMHQAGAVAYKAFLPEVGNYRHVNDAELLAGMTAVAAVGGLVGIHCENDAVLKYNRARLQAAGRKDPLAHAECHSELAEIEAVSRVIHLAEVTGVRLHIVHISTGRAVRLVAAARRRGVAVTCETCPHYLTLDLGDLERLGPYAKCAPALRARETVEELWQLLLAGEVQLVATDHSPYTFALKEQGRDDIWQAYNGLTGMQTMLPCLLHEGVHRRGLRPQDLVRLVSSEPARLFGLWPRKGSLAEGADADLILVDPNATWQVAAADLLYKNPWSPYAGQTLQGVVETTILRGQVVWADGRLQAPAGTGRFVPGPGASQAAAGTAEVAGTGEVAPCGW